MTDGICPFANQIVGREHLIGWTKGYSDRVGFCDHTAGGFYSTLERWQFWNDPNGDGNTSDAVSVHFAIARDGRILQVLNIFDTAFAQGITNLPNTWPPYDQMGRRNPNLYLISTEHEDAETVNGQTHFIPGSEWTPEQYAADLAVKRWCIEEVKRVTGRDLMRFGYDSLSGHYQFDPVNRAFCPGQFWKDVYHQTLWNDISAPPGPARVWAFGNEHNGVELRGLQQVTWINGLEVLAVGDPEGVGLGRIAKLFGDTWWWLRKNDIGEAYWSQTEGD